MVIKLLFIFILLFSTRVYALVDSAATAETQALYTRLQNTMGVRIFFGQHFNNTIYNCDQKKISGKYPVVYSLDFRDILNTTNKRDSIRNHYAQGGIITFCWHMPNYVTGNTDSHDESGDPVVNVLSGGTARTTYLTALDTLATYLNELTDYDGNLIPVIVRPFHENDGNWFWWGIDTSTDAQFKALWQDFVVYLRDTKGVHNVLYAYSPEILNGYTYDGNLYPGDTYVDIFGIDRYSDGNIADIMTYYQQASDAAVTHSKVFAITEGLRDQSQAFSSTYWTVELVNPILADSKAKKAAYLAVWTSGNWGPLDNRSDEADFITMTQNSGIEMLQYRSRNKNNNLKGMLIY